MKKIILVMFFLIITFLCSANVWDIPHIAGNNWVTTIEILNTGETDQDIQFFRWDYEGIPHQSPATYTVPAGGVLTLNNTDFAYDGIARISSNPNASLHVKLSYRFGQSESLCEFLIPNHTYQTYFIPNPVYEHMDWFGVAVANFSDEQVDVTLKAICNGQVLSTNTYTILPHQKLVDLSDVLMGEAYRDVDMVVISSTGKFAVPLSITGNSAQDRHVFFMGVEVQSYTGSSRRFIIPHIAQSIWSTIVTIYNPSESTETTTVISYNLDGTIHKKQSFSIPAASQINIAAGVELPYSGTAEIDAADSLIVKLSYRFRDSRSICEFFVPDKMNEEWLVPNSVQSWFQWFGLAVYNPYSEAILVTFEAWKDGAMIAEIETAINPHMKLVDLSSGIWDSKWKPFAADVGYTDVDTVLIKCDRPIPPPISITGNQEQDRHVFFPGDPVSGEWVLGIAWESMDGPIGGPTTLLAPDPYEADVLYAGTDRGLYKSTDVGDNWHIITQADTYRTNAIAFSEDGVLIPFQGTLHVVDRTSEQLTSLSLSCSDLLTSNGHVIAANSTNFLPSETAEDAFDDLIIQVADLSSDTLTWTDITPPADDLDPVLTQLSGVISEARWIGPTHGFVCNGSYFLCLQVAAAEITNDMVSSTILDTVDAELLIFSDDSGQSWQTVASPFGSGLRVMSMTQDFDNPDILYATAGPTVSEGDFKTLKNLLAMSADGGETWSSVTGIESVLSQFVSDIDLVGNDLILTNVDQAFCRLYGAGFNQMEITAFPNVPGISSTMFISEIIFDPHDQQKAYGRNAGIGIIKSEDDRQTWSVMEKGLISSQVANVTIHPENSDIVFTSTNQNYLPQKTEDFGANWTTLEVISSFSDELQVDPHNTQHLLLVDEVSVIQESFDLGATFALSCPEFIAHRIFDIDLSEEGNGVLYASHLGTGISEFSDLNNVQSILASGLEFEFWSHMPDSSDYAYDLAIDPGDSGILYATYSPKVFEDFASLMRYDDEQSENDGWSEILKVSGATGMTAVAVDASDSDNIYAGLTGNQGLIYHTETGGASWSVLNDDFTFVTIHAMAIDPQDGQIAFAAPWGGGLFKTTDGGTSWTKIQTPTPSIAGVVIDPSDSDRMYIGDRTSPSIYMTRDGGINWTMLIELGHEAYYRIFSMIMHENVLYFSAMLRSDGMIGLFSDGPFSGHTFMVEESEAVQLAGEMSRGVVSFCSDESGLYAVVHLQGVYRLDDLNWTDISGDLPDMGFNSVSVDSSGYLYVTGGCDLNLQLENRIGDLNRVFEIYRSTDDGVHWEPLIQNNLFGSDIKQLLFHPQVSSTWIAGTGNGVFVSRDSGATWDPENTGLNFTAIGAMVIGDDVIYAGTLGGGVYAGVLENDHSITWAETNGPYPEIYNIQIRIDPSDSSTIYATAFPGGVFKTIDGGNNWSESNFGLPSFDVEDPLLQGYYSLEIDPHQTSRLYLGIYSRGVYQSNSGGLTWYPRYGTLGQNTSIMSKGITRLAVDPTDSTRLYLATHDGMYMSSDSGENWVDFNEGLGTTDVLSVRVSDSGQVFVGTAGYGVYVYNSTTESFDHMGRSVGVGEWAPWERRLYQYSALLFDPHVIDQVYLGHFPGGFFISSDAGRSWADHSLGLGNDGMFSLVMHPLNPDVMFAGTYNGVMKSEDGGLSWTGARNGLPPEQWPFTVAIDPTKPEVMYLSTKNGQNAGFCSRNTFCGVVMKSIDGGNSWFKIMNGLSTQYEYYGLIIHPENTNVLFLSSNSGVFASKNGGGSWFAINSGLPSLNMQMRDNVAQNLQITVDLDYLVLAVTGYGCWKADISDLFSDD